MRGPLQQPPISFQGLGPVPIAGWWIGRISQRELRDTQGPVDCQAKVDTTRLRRRRNAEALKIFVDDFV